MKYEVGDIVRVREDLRAGGDFSKYLYVTDDMAELAGQLVTITDICSTFDDCYYYTIDLDGKTWHWTDEMFEDIKIENTPKNIDIGYYLEYCGHRVIKNVYYGGYAHDHDHVFCTTDDSLNQYTLPIDSIEFIIPHED